MRAFHFAWFTFFIAFSAWFALAPLTPVVVKSLERDLDEQYTCSDQVCTRSDGNGTFVGCILTGTMTDTVLVTSGGFGPLKGTIPTGYYPLGKDKRDDRTSEKCSAIKARLQPKLWTANILSVSVTVVMRFLIGPLCERLGPRTLQATVLLVCSIPVFCASQIHDFEALAVVRAFIGIGGATFVVTQYWTTIMFSRESVGTANGTSAGWGKLGGGFTQI